MNSLDIPYSRKESGKESIEEILEEFEPEMENLIPILHRIQDSHKFHYIPQEVITDVAHYLNSTPSEVYGVISFYTMFSVEPRGKYVIRVCESAPCQVLGSSTVLSALEQILGIRVGETTEDHLFTLEESSCLGVCERAPAMMINEKVYGELTVEKIMEIIGGLK